MPYAEGKAWQNRLREMGDDHRNADRLCYSIPILVTGNASGGREIVKLVPARGNNKHGARTKEIIEFEKLVKSLRCPGHVQN
jgi:hypothetical protein